MTGFKKDKKFPKKNGKKNCLDKEEEEEEENDCVIVSM